VSEQWGSLIASGLRIRAFAVPISDMDALLRVQLRVRPGNTVAGVVESGWVVVVLSMALVGMVIVPLGGDEAVAGRRRQPCPRPLTCWRMRTPERAVWFARASRLRWCARHDRSGVWARRRAEVQRCRGAAGRRPSHAPLACPSAIEAAIALW
jgi:hypothetical protein